MEHTHGLWKHKSRQTTFTLVVDDFGICYFNEADKKHLIDALEARYRVKVGEGKKYVGIDFEWENGKNRQVILSMNGYIPKANKEFGHPNPIKPVYGPTPFRALEYKREIQYAEADTSPKVKKK